MSERDLETSDGVRLALYRRRPYAEGRPAVLLVHGAFGSHTAYLRTDAGRGGLSHYLGARGYDVWLADLRHHGRSDREPRRFTWSFEDLIRKDAPAIVAQLRREIGAAPLAWIGHSFGAVVGLCWLAWSHPQAPLSGIATLGAPGPAAMGAVRWGLAALTILICRTLGYFPARTLRFGSEDEAGGVLAEWMRWNVNGRWVGRDGFDYFAAMARIRVPLLSVAGAADRFFAPAAACRQVVEQWGDPRKRFALAGPGGRLNHRGLLLDRRSIDVCWPLLADWLHTTL